MCPSFSYSNQNCDVIQTQLLIVKLPLNSYLQVHSKSQMSGMSGGSSLYLVLPVSSYAMLSGLTCPQLAENVVAAEVSALCCHTVILLKQTTIPCPVLSVVTCLPHMPGLNVARYNRQYSTLEFKLAGSTMCRQEGRILNLKIYRKQEQRDWMSLRLTLRYTELMNGGKSSSLHYHDLIVVRECI